MSLTFEWDTAKAESNLLKHGVSFQDAIDVFGDPLALTIRDALHSEAEERFVTTGQTSAGLLLVVIHTDRDSTIRIIGARRATSRERRSYEHAD